MVVFNALKEGTSEKLGNFYNYFVKSITRVLLPLSLAVALVLVFQGTPMNWAAKAPLVTVQGDSVSVSRGPAAALIGIKQIGTNGGGFFGVNSAHPLENPTYLTNAVENGAIVLIPIAMALAFGYYLGRPKLGWMVFGVMTAGYLLLQVPTVYLEMHGNPAISAPGRQPKPWARWRARKCASARPPRRCGPSKPPSRATARSMPCTTRSRPFRAWTRCWA